jgi:ubiquitin carboxyl-terminal hydrolase 4/11/15
MKYAPINSHMWNKILKLNLKEGVDFEIIDEQMWKLISKKKKIAHEITRDSTVVNGIKTVNVFL